MFRLRSIVAKCKVNKIGGNLYKQWGTWLNSTLHVKPYQHRGILKSKLIRLVFVGAYIHVLHGRRKFLM